MKNHIKPIKQYEKTDERPQLGAFFKYQPLPLPRGLRDAEAIKLKRKGRTSDGFGAQRWTILETKISSYALANPR